MNDWMDNLISQCLADIPQGKYRDRAEKELRDHMETLYLSLTESGMGPDHAQGEALRTMGDPKKLRAEYETAWRRTFPARAVNAAFNLPYICFGCMLMGGLYIMTFFCLAVVGFTYDAVSSVGFSFPILAGGANLLVFSCVLFLVPFTLGAYYLRCCFRDEARPVGWITLGLLAAWVGEKVSIILLSALIYAMPLCPELLVRIYNGGDTTAPWMNPVYVVLTFGMCVALGQIFGQSTEKNYKTA